MGEKVPKKMNLKEIGIEKIILIAIAGIVLLLANFSEWKNAISEKTEKKEEKTVQTDQNDAYVSALENKLVHILENVDGVGKAGRICFSLPILASVLCYMGGWI